MDRDTIQTAVAVIEALDSTRTSQSGDMLVSLVGAAVLIRTVTMTVTGRIEKVDDKSIKLSDAAWIADTGRFSTALTTGTLAEVEPFPDAVYVSRGAIVDLTYWSHSLPRDAKS